MEVMEMTDKERKDAKMSTIYEIRLLVDGKEQENYTKAEILELLDTIARAKDTE